MESVFGFISVLPVSSVLCRIGTVALSQRGCSVAATSSTLSSDDNCELSFILLLSSLSIILQGAFSAYRYEAIIGKPLQCVQAAALVVAVSETAAPDADSLLLVSETLHCCRFASTATLLCLLSRAERTSAWRTTTPPRCRPRSPSASAAAVPPADCVSCELHRAAALLLESLAPSLVLAPSLPQSSCCSAYLAEDRLLGEPYCHVLDELSHHLQQISVGRHPDCTLLLTLLTIFLSTAHCPLLQALRSWPRRAAGGRCSECGCSRS